MANAELTAPLKKDKRVAEPKKEVKIGEGAIAETVFEDSNEHIALTQEFDIGKKYMFNLAEESPERDLPVLAIIGTKTTREPHQKFKPFQNIVFTSQIVWKGQRRMVRYYDGCDSIFVDKQPKEKDVIDQYIAQTKKRAFLEGKFGAYGDERMLLLYLNICSWNADSPFRTKTANTIFLSVNADKIATEESLKIDQIEKALEYAADASVSKMIIHANYLGIPTEDYDSGNQLTPKEIRAEYRKYALRDAKYFIETFDNKSIEAKYFIEKALEKGTISNKFNPNKATGGSSNTVICDISGLKTPESIAQRLFEFSQSEEGEEFMIQLKAISE